MTEFERSKYGLPHVFDKEMMRMFQQACHLTREYNLTDEDENAKREKILTQLLKSAGKLSISFQISTVSIYTVNHAIDPDERAREIHVALFVKLQKTIRSDTRDKYKKIKLVEVHMKVLLVHGFTPEDVMQDEEGLQTMRTLGYNMAWMLKNIENRKGRCLLWKIGFKKCQNSALG